MRLKKYQGTTVYFAKWQLNVTELQTPAESHVTDYSVFVNNGTCFVETQHPGQDRGHEAPEGAPQAVDLRVQRGHEQAREQQDRRDRPQRDGGRQAAAPEEDRAQGGRDRDLRRQATLGVCHRLAHESSSSAG